MLGQGRKGLKDKHAMDLKRVRDAKPRTAGMTLRFISSKASTLQIAQLISLNARSFLAKIKNNFFKLRI